jgi:PAS domain S-box-containing protein
LQPAEIVNDVFQEEDAAMSPIARIYISLIVTAGAAAIARGMLLWAPHDVLRFAFYLCLAVPAASLKVSLPGITGTMSVLFVLLLASIVDLGLPETVIIGITCILIQSFWRAKVRPRPVQLAFSVANIAIAVTCSDFVYHAILPANDEVNAGFRIALAATVFFVTNTFPVAAVIALTEGKSVRQVWSNCYCWSFPYYLVGAAIVGVLTFANRMLNWQAWILILPVIYVIYRSYDLYLRTLAGERQRAEDQRKHADEIAAMHARTIEALASAVSANAKLDAVIQASPLAILSMDRLGKVTTWNAMAERFFGLKAEEALGQPLPLSNNINDDSPSILDRTISGESITGLQFTQRRKNGSTFEAAIWSAPLRDPSDESAGIVIAVADVSDRKRLEEQLRLSQKMEAVGRLAGGIAHDFNNLLTIINGYSSILVHSLESDAYAKTQAEEISQAGNRAAELVSQLLTFSRRQVNQPKPIEVNALVHDVSRMLQRLLVENIEFKTNLDDRAGWIRADRNQMEGVLMNLATNARDAMPSGGVLSIATSRVEVEADSTHHTADLPPGSYVCLTVTDTGHGMDAETLQHLFEPFFTTKEKGKGTGLGLSSVYGGVQHNGGRISVSSEVGKGTVFSIYIPAYANDPVPELRQTPASHAGAGCETILLVEDEASVRRMLREALSRSGYRVWEAGNGAEALENWGARVREVHLLITDVVMPVMNGKRLAEELRELRRDLPVIFMSGHAEEVLTNQGMLDPSVDLLPKPFLPEALITKARQVLDRVHCAPRP